MTIAPMRRGQLRFSSDEANGLRSSYAFRRDLQKERPSKEPLPSCHITGTGAGYHVRYSPSA